MRTLFALGIVVVSTVCGQFVTAQPPERRDGPPPERRDGLRDAIDTNGDHELDAEEMKNATANLAKADRNGDGKIDHEEFRPPLPAIPRGEGGFRGPPPGRERGSEGGPVRGGGFRGEGGPRPEGGPSPERFVERAMTFDADGDGKLDRGGMAERGTGPAGDRSGGFRPGDGPRRRPDTAEGTESGERPERPRRPE